MIQNKDSIWFIHPYAGGPGVGRYDRPFHLARHWQEMGGRSVVIAPSAHHLLDVPRKSGMADISGVTYDFLYAPPYRGNGFGRVFNMFFFTLQLLIHGSALVRRHGRPAMIVASSPHPYAYLAAERLARRFGCRCVFEVRDLWPLSLVELAGAPPSHPLVKFTDWLERRAYRCADAVVSLLPCAYEYMSERGVSRDRWHYIPNGVEISQKETEFINSPPLALARKWRSEGRVVVVYAGALGLPNNAESLIRAIAQQQACATPASAILIGRGELQVKLARLIVQLELQDRVVMFAQIPKLAVLSLLREVDIGFMSLRPEPIFRFGISPNKLFDYMIAGLPVLFAVKAGNDPVAESGCGLSVHPERTEEIVAALNALAVLSPKERIEIGQRGQLWIKQHHDYARLARQYASLVNNDARV